MKQKPNPSPPPQNLDSPALAGAGRGKGSARKSGHAVQGEGWGEGAASERLVVSEGPITPYLAKSQLPRHSRENGNPEWVPLEQICEIIQGQSPPGSTYNTDGTGLPFFQGKAEFGELYPTPAKWCTEPTKVARKDDVLISIRAPVGPTNLCPMEACIGRGLATLRPRDGMSSKYVLYAMRSTANALADKATGTTFAAVSGKQLRAHLVPFVPPSEQERIVAELETQLTRIDASVTALKRVHATLKRYRASVLKAACEGRLVPTEAELARREGRGYESGPELHARILKLRESQWRERGKYRQPETPCAVYVLSVPEGWYVTTLDALIVEGPQNGLYLPKEKYGSGHPILRIDDYQIGWSRPSAELQRVAADEQTVSTYALRSGDLVINRVNSPSHLGKSIAVRPRNIPALFESNMMRARLADEVKPEFVELYLQSADGRRRLTARAKWAVNQASINQQDVRAAPIVLPPLTEQHRIVAEVERRLSVIEELEATVAANLKRAERLRQAVLRGAFNARL